MDAEEREVVRVEEKRVFVAVGSDVEVGKSLLEWAIGRFEGRKICLVHVHTPKRSGSVGECLIGLLLTYCWLLFLEFYGCVKMRCDLVYVGIS